LNSEPQSTGWEMVDVTGLNDLPEGKATRVEVEGRPFAIFNVGGQLRAYRDQCPHQGAAISCGIITGVMQPSEPREDPEFSNEGLVVACPRHRWKFSIETGEALFETDSRRLISVPVSVEGDRVLIGIRRLSAATPAV
jgi:3-phenylpropionate/trans-cinnamate dioxygenase ferredoxin subunit